MEIMADDGQDPRDFGGVDIFVSVAPGFNPNQVLLALARQAVVGGKVFAHQVSISPKGDGMCSVGFEACGDYNERGSAELLPELNGVLAHEVPGAARVYHRAPNGTFLPVQKT